MSDERELYRRAGVLFEEAIELEVSKRLAHVEAATEGDDELRALVLEMLAHDREPDGLDIASPIDALREAADLLPDSEGDRLSAARMMRRLAVDGERARREETPDAAGRSLTGSIGEPMDLLVLDGALDDLETRSERMVRLVELRFFGGLEVAEAAQVLGTTEETVMDEWAFARAWLSRALERDEGRA